MKFMPKHRFFNVFFVCAALGLALAGISSAEVDGHQPQIVASPLTRIPQAWQSAWAALNQGKLAQASDYLQDLNRLKIEAGYESMERYSLLLLVRGEEALRAGNRDDADFLERKALELSPHSPRVRLKAGNLSRSRGIAPVRTLRAFRDLWYHPELSLKILSSAPYRVLWAACLGLYVVILFYLILHVQELLRGVMAYLSVANRGILGPLVVAVLLVVPELFGPLPAIFVWAITISFVLQGRKVFIATAAMLLTMWGAILPYRAMMQLFVTDPTARILLAELGGDFVPEAVTGIDWRDASLAQKDSALLDMGLSVALLRRGEFGAARQALSRVEMRLGRTSWVKASLGLVALGSSDLVSAQDMFGGVGGADGASADFLFDYSKLKFALSDTAESKRLLAQANVRDAERVKELESRERVVAPGGLRGYMFLRPGGLRLLSALRADLGAEESSRSPLGARWAILLGGALLFILALVPGQGVRRHRGQVYYSRFQVPEWLPRLMRFVPGIPWSRRGNDGIAIVLVTLVAVLLLPLTSGEFSLLRGEVFSYWAGFYWGVVGLIVLGIVALGYFVSEER